jgi:hypothetical protein
VKQSSNIRCDEDTIAKSLYLSCQLMDQTLKRGMHQKNKKVSEVEHYASQWTKQLIVVLPKNTGSGWII